MHIVRSRDSYLLVLLLNQLGFAVIGVYAGFKPASYPATPGLEGVGKVGNFLSMPMHLCCITPKGLTYV